MIHSRLKVIHYHRPYKDVAILNATGRWFSSFQPPSNHDFAVTQLFHQVPAFIWISGKLILAYYSALERLGTIMLCSSSIFEVLQA